MGVLGGEVWTATPGSLGRLGVYREACVVASEVAGAAVALGVELRGRVEAVFGRLLAGVLADSAGASGADGFPIAAQQAGDALLLLTASVSRADGSARWERLRERIRDKNFARSWAGFQERGLETALERTLAGTEFGCRVHLSRAVVEALVEADPAEAAVVSCVGSAHLALTNFVERMPRFRAESLGRIMAERRFEVSSEA